MVMFLEGPSNTFQWFIMTQPGEWQRRWDEWIWKTFRRKNEQDQWIKKSRNGGGKGVFFLIKSRKKTSKWRFFTYCALYYSVGNFKEFHGKHEPWLYPWHPSIDATDMVIAVCPACCRSKWFLTSLRVGGMGSKKTSQKTWSLSCLRNFT